MSVYSWDPGTAQLELNALALSSWVALVGLMGGIVFVWTQLIVGVITAMSQRKTQQASSIPKWFDRAHQQLVPSLGLVWWSIIATASAVLVISWHVLHPSYVMVGPSDTAAQIALSGEARLGRLTNSRYA